MRAGAVRTGTDDDEVRPGVSLGDDGGADVGGHLVLGSAGLQPFADPALHPVDGRAGGGQCLHLVRALAHPQLGDRLAGQGQLRPGHDGLGVERVHGRHVVVDGEQRGVGR